ncbi:glycerate kinase family protein [Aquimarina mytili]|uniref:Glycerate kinase n=1 Tax=Aquimarina mytili TaxID=874423 RepID=A0A937DBY3_9FLAO|nr:glycerate kinase [Aquimarina mytili]MBL0684341.1 glycerate kinase [Aquimarina mytili]
MKILVAPDKFKDSLNATELCDAIASGINKFNPNIEVIKHPLADGGDGTLNILDQHLNLDTISVPIKDPLFRTIKASYKKTNTVAYIEMAEASGLALLNENERNCMHTTSYGTGQLILDAITKGVKTIYLSLGGSATCDAGIGLAQALGYTFVNQNNESLKPIGANLGKIYTIRPPRNKNILNKVNFISLCDVDNPLFGPQGASHMFSAQKGANTKEIIILDKGLSHFAAVIDNQLGKNITNIPGAGAAGGIGGGSIAFLNAKLQSGIKTILEITQFSKKIEKIDLIFTGEGKIDQQTLNGKVVFGVSQLAKTKNIPTYVIAGTSDLSISEIKSIGITSLKTVLSASKDKHEAFTNTKHIVEKLAFEMMKQKLLT